MNASPPVDAWTPPPADVDWMRNPEARSNYVAALERHNEVTIAGAVEFLGLWRREISGQPVDRRDIGPAELIAELVRVAHNRRQLGAAVAASFKDIAAAVGVSAERLAEAVRDALEAELAA